MCYIELAFVENQKLDFRCDMISGLAWSAVNWGGFDPSSGQTNTNKIDICFFFAKHAALLWSKNNE